MVLVFFLGIIIFISGIVSFIHSFKRIEEKEVVDNKVIFHLILLLFSLLVFFISLSQLSYYYSKIEPIECIDSSTFTSNCIGNGASASIIFIITIGISIVLGIVTNIILDKIYKSGSKSLSIFAFFLYYIAMAIFSILLLVEYNGLLISKKYDSWTSILEAFSIVSPILMYTVISIIRRKK